MRCRSIESCRSSPTSLPIQLGWWGFGPSTGRPPWGNMGRSPTPRSTRSSPRAGRRWSLVAPASISGPPSPTSICRPRRGPEPGSGGRRSTTRAARRRRTSVWPRSTPARPRPSTRTTGAASYAPWSLPRPVRRSRRRVIGSGRASRGTRPLSSASTCRRPCSTSESPCGRAPCSGRRPGRSSARAQRPDLGDRAQDDGHRRDRRPSARRSMRRTRRAHAAVCELPAEVDAANPGHRYRRGRPPGGRDRR